MLAIDVVERQALGRLDRVTVSFKQGLPRETTSRKPTRPSSGDNRKGIVSSTVRFFHGFAVTVMGRLITHSRRPAQARCLEDLSCQKTSDAAGYLSLATTWMDYPCAGVSQGPDEIRGQSLTDRAEKAPYPRVRPVTTKNEEATK